jgi:hypothetical protein
MEGEKDRFGELMRLLERAREDIYFAAKDQELIEKLKARLAKVDEAGREALRLVCPKCQGKLESYTFMEYLLDRCSNCGGVWLDKDEVDSILTRLSRGPLAFLLDWLVSTHGRRAHAR